MAAEPTARLLSAEPKAGLDEFGRIDRYFKPLAKACPAALGLTDDAAVLDLAPGRQLVVTTDAMVAGVHFLPDDPPGDIAAKLLRVNLSDLAAMGAAPLGYTLVTVLPRAVEEHWLGEFAAGLALDQARYGIGLLGGDSVTTAGPITLSLTALGTVPAGRALTRSAAGPEDLVYLTGSPGDAALGLALVQGRLTVGEADDRAFLISRLRRPEPRLALAQDLLGPATAAIDVSDGLVADLGHLCAASGLEAVIDLDRLPLSAATRRVIAADPAWWMAPLAGGDDYELVFAAPAVAGTALAALAVRHGVAITAIGRFGRGVTGRVELRGQEAARPTLAAGGWQHF
ncbi:MAG: thiamine-phosphate kinase [Azospirillum sp.]|nr:thiamine-phosphate kinase [Azospirillum sp.]